MTAEEAAKVILEYGANVDPEQYRMGHTKVVTGLPITLKLSNTKIQPIKTQFRIIKVNYKYKFNTIIV